MTRPARIGAALLIFATASLGAQSPAPGTSSIAGIVIDDQRQPVARIVVDVDGRRGATGDDGRFEITGLPAGVHHACIVQSGLFEPNFLWFGSTAIEWNGTGIELDTGERAVISITLSRPGVITGTLVDDDGEPMEGAQVRLDRQPSRDDGRWTPELEATTDRRGRYRLHSVPAGEYLVSGHAPNRYAIHRSTAGIDQMMLFPWVYWPGVTERSAAHSISIGPGEQIDRIDLRLMAVPVSSLHVTVRSSDGLSVSAQIGLTGRPFPEQRGSLERAPTGERTYQLLPAASYIVEASSEPPVSGVAGRQGGDPAVARQQFFEFRPEWGRISVTTSGNSPTDVILQLMPTASIAGTIVFQDPKPKDFRGIFGLRAGPSPFPPPARFEAVTESPDTFLIRGLLPGRYWFGGAPKGWELSLTRSGVDLAGALDIREHEEIRDVIATLRKAPAAVISGTVSDITGDLTRAVVLLNQNERLWDSTCRGLAVAQPTTKGNFVFAEIAAGSYFLARGGADRPNCADVAKLRELASAAARVTVSPGETKTVSLRGPSPGVPLPPTTPAHKIVR